MIRGLSIYTLGVESDGFTVSLALEIVVPLFLEVLGNFLPMHLAPG